MIYDHNGAPDPGAARGKFTFPKLINDPVCHASSISKGPFLKFFLEKYKGCGGLTDKTPASQCLLSAYIRNMSGVPGNGDDKATPKSGPVVIVLSACRLN